MPIVILVDLDSEDVIVDVKWIVFYILPASIPCFLTAIGLYFMCKTNCKCKIQFKCCCPENLEKRDNNQIYGEYGDYDVMWVCILTGKIYFYPKNHLHLLVFKQATDANAEYALYDYVENNWDTRVRDNNSLYISN